MLPSAYALYGGSDIVFVFVTPEMARILNAATDEPRARLTDENGSEPR